MTADLSSPLSRSSTGDNWANRDEIIAKYDSFDRYTNEALALDAPVVSELRATLLG